MEHIEQSISGIKHQLSILKRDYYNSPVIRKNLEKAIDDLESARIRFDNAVGLMQLEKAGMHVKELR